MDLVQLDFFLLALWGTVTAIGLLCRKNVSEDKKYKKESIKSVAKVPGRISSWKTSWLTLLVIIYVSNPNKLRYAHPPNNIRKHDPPF